MAMPMQQVEFEFPDPDKKDAGDVEVEVEGNEAEFELEVEGAVGREVVGKKAPKGEVEIEIEDDTPVADRGRKPSKPPEEVTDEELESYSDKVKGRIKHLSKGYHDERRAKETALREREELERYTKQLVDENKTLKGSVDKSHNTLVESAQQQVKTELFSAKQQYKQAYEGGQSEEMVEAQAALNSAQIRADKVGNLKLREETTLQTPTNTEESRKATPTIQRDPQAIAWADNNSWFGADDEMTAFALGLHTKLGTNPRSEEYYEKIDSRMRQIFPDHFDEGIEDEPAGRKKKSSNVVAPATRSTSPRKVTLSQTQVALAKRLGVSLEDYAKQAAVLMRKQD
jgi:hypothetical protein